MSSGSTIFGDTMMKNVVHDMHIGSMEQWPFISKGYLVLCRGVLYNYEISLEFRVVHDLNLLFL